MNMAPTGPTVFVRTVSTPPGLPWDQARMADLDARAGAPLPLGEVVYRLGRLDPWRPGRPSRYFACYVRAREVGDRLVATATVDGRSISLEFVSGVERGRRLRRLGTLAAASGVTSLLVLAAVVSAIDVRSDAAARMDRIDTAVVRAMRQAQQVQSMQAQTRALAAAKVHGQSIGDFLNDLAWVSRAKAPGAHIDAVHWDHGYMGVETRGDTPPFGQVDRPVLKAAKPVRPAVWLWGIGPP